MAMLALLRKSKKAALGSSNGLLTQPASTDSHKHVNSNTTTMHFEKKSSSNEVTLTHSDAMEPKDSIEQVASAIKLLSVIRELHMAK